MAPRSHGNSDGELDNTTAIVLAAGESRRMGAQKLLLPFAGKTVVGHVVSEIHRGGVHDIVVVTGKDHEGVARVLAGREARIVRNERYEEGMLSSVRAGLRALSAYSESVLIALGDQPAIHPRIVRDLIRALASSSKTIAVPVFEGRRGHPLLFSRIHRDEILTGFDEVGLRGLLRQRSECLLEIPVESDAVLSDMASPEDYRRELRAFEARAASS